MSNLIKIETVTNCINSLYRAEEITPTERSELLEDSLLALKTGNWQFVQKKLFHLREHSYLKKTIDFTIDAIL